MKKFLMLICFSFLSVALYAHGTTLTDHSKIKERSYFKIMEPIDLRTEKDYSAKVAYPVFDFDE